MRLPLFVIFSILTSVNAWSQSDSLANPVRPVSVFAYWDYGKTATVWTDFETKHEAGLELRLLDKFQLIGEVGSGLLKPSDAFQNVIYQVEGTYWRAGVGYLGAIDAGNKIGLGLRYAQGMADDEAFVLIQTTSGISNSYERVVARNGIQSRWMEIVLNSEQQLVPYRKNPDAIINKIFILGINVRYRVMLDYDRQPGIDIYTIPGYGRSTAASTMAVNLFLKFRIF